MRNFNALLLATASYAILISSYAFLSSVISCLGTAILIYWSRIRASASLKNFVQYWIIWWLEAAPLPLFSRTRLIYGGDGILTNVDLKGCLIGLWTEIDDEKWVYDEKKRKEMKDCTWEPPNNFSTCRAALRAFHKKNPSKPGLGEIKKGSKIVSIDGPKAN